MLPEIEQRRSELEGLCRRYCVRRLELLRWRRIGGVGGWRVIRIGRCIRARAVCQRLAYPMRCPLFTRADSPVDWLRARAPFEPRDRTRTASSRACRARSRHPGGAAAEWRVVGGRDAPAPAIRRASASWWFRSGSAPFQSTRAPAARNGRQQARRARRDAGFRLRVRGAGCVGQGAR